MCLLCMLAVVCVVMCNDVCVCVGGGLVCCVVYVLGVVCAMKLRGVFVVYAGECVRGRLRPTCLTRVKQGSPLTHS